MKTNQEMIRTMGVFQVIQRTSDGYFNATSLLQQWNTTNVDEKRDLDNFWKSTHLNKLMSEIAENENVSRNAIHKQIKEAENKLINYEQILKQYENSIKIKKNNQRLR